MNASYMIKVLFLLIIDLRKNERTMTCVADLFTEKLNKTTEENKARAKEVEGIYTCVELSQVE